MEMKWDWVDWNGLTFSTLATEELNGWAAMSDLMI